VSAAESRSRLVAERQLISDKHSRPASARDRNRYRIKANWTKIGLNFRLMRHIQLARVRTAARIGCPF
ncbi:MAG: hypothetical protein DMF00_08990, partial [Verrucomicrobia bacterium]